MTSNAWVCPRCSTKNGPAISRCKNCMTRRTASTAEGFGASASLIECMRCGRITGALSGGLQLSSGYLCSWCVSDVLPGRAVTTGSVNWGGVVLGLVIAVVAIGLSVATYEAASEGGTYVVFWGAALWGGWFALKSLIRRR